MQTERYTIRQLAALAGISTRTLRFYDEIGLLPPAGVAENGYRYYTAAEVRRLQEILFYCELGIERRAIADLLKADPAQKQCRLQAQLEKTRQEQQRLQALTQNLQKAILELKGEYTMKDTERFEGLKRSAIAENEKKYGAELREKYGEKTIEAANKKMQGMSEEKWQQMEQLRGEIDTMLGRLVPGGDPTCAEAMQLAALHKQWLCMAWPDGLYSPQRHIGMAQMYRADERFAANYEKVIAGGNEYLCAAIEAYCAKK